MDDRGLCRGVNYNPNNGSIDAGAAIAIALNARINSLNESNYGLTEFGQSRFVLIEYILRNKYNFSLEEMSDNWSKEEVIQSFLRTADLIEIAA